MARPPTLLQAVGRAPPKGDMALYHVVPKPYPTTVHYTTGDSYFK